MPLDQFSLYVFLLGIVAGAIGSLLGLGGGMILVPALLLFTKLPHNVVVSASLMTVVTSSIASSEIKLKDNLIPLKLATRVEAFGIVGGIIGAFTSKYFEKNVIMTLLGGVMLLVSGKVLLGEVTTRIRSQNGTHKTAKQIESVQPRSSQSFLILGIISCFAGSLSGLLGIGGGIILVPSLSKFAGLNLKSAVATSAYVMGIAASGGAFVHYMQGHMDFNLTTLSVLGVFPGAIFGSWILRRISADLLRVIFAIVLLVIGVKLCFLA